MSETLINTAALWIGYGVMFGFGIAGGACIVASFVGIAALAFSHYCKRLFNSAVNWQAVHAWKSNGRPEWKQGPDRVFRLVPTDGEFEWPDDAQSPQ